MKNLHLLSYSSTVSSESGIALTFPLFCFRIGRHSKSLDTERFVCALCKGQLVLCQPTQKDGTPARAQLTPFAKYVKENYGSTKKEQHGLSHAAVMQKLSVEFALKTRLLDS